MVLQHQLPEGTSCVDQITFLLELLEGGPRSLSCISSTSPFLNRALDCVRSHGLEEIVRGDALVFEQAGHIFPGLVVLMLACLANEAF